MWRFSLRLYRMPGVAKTCLNLQDRKGADVNLLLYCCWMGLQGRRLSTRSLRSVMATVAAWQRDVVRPLRQARRATRKRETGIAEPWMERLHARIGVAELDAEYVEQLVLAGYAAGMPPLARRHEPRSAAAVNVRRYLELSDAGIGRSEIRHLRALLDAAWSARGRLRLVRCASV